MMDPQQELFTKIKLAVEAVIGKENVYDGFLPPDGTIHQRSAVLYQASCSRLKRQ